MTTQKVNSAFTIAEKKQIAEECMSNLMSIYNKICNTFIKVNSCHSSQTDVEKSALDAANYILESFYGIGIIHSDLIREEVNHE